MPRVFELEFLSFSSFYIEIEPLLRPLQLPSKTFCKIVFMDRDTKNLRRKIVDLVSVP